MNQYTDETLAQKYGNYAGFTTDASPALVEHFGEDPLQEVKRLLKVYIKPESRILDIGCGAGQTLCQFAPQVQEAWGIDQGGDLLTGARARVRQLGLTNVTLVEGNIAERQEVDQLPDNYFDIAYTESGPSINEHLLRKLTNAAFFLQEVGGNYGDYHLQEIMGRVPYTNFANHYWDQTQLVQAAELDLLPVSFKQCFWEVYFRDLAHLEAYVSQDSVLSNWRLSPRPYQPDRDRPALELYARYNTTSKGIRLLYHIQILVWRRATIHYYPIDGVYI